MNKSVKVPLSEIDEVKNGFVRKHSVTYGITSNIILHRGEEGGNLRKVEGCGDIPSQCFFVKVLREVLV